MFLIFFVIFRGHSSLLLGGPFYSYFFRVRVLFGPEAPKSNASYSCKNASQTVVIVLKNHKKQDWRNVETHQTRHGSQKKTQGNTKRTNIHKQLKREKTKTT